ncbi:unnamed protein product [Boreogadus saida]
MVEKNWGKGTLAMNRDMEEKGIVLRELSCRTCRRAPRAGAAGLPPRPTPAGPASFGGSSAPGVHPPEQPRRPDGFDGSAPGESSDHFKVSVAQIGRGAEGSGLASSPGGYPDDD